MIQAHFQLLLTPICYSLLDSYGKPVVKPKFRVQRKHTLPLVGRAAELQGRETG